MKPFNRSLAACLCLASMVMAPSLSMAQQAIADTYPSRTITFVVPYAAGGSSDARSRQIANRLAMYFGKPVIVENKPGAGGNIGTEFIAKAAPDGHVIGLGNFAPLAVNKSLFTSMRFDPATDLAPIVMIEKGPMVMSVNRNSTYKTVNEFIQGAKAKPGGISYASGGLGGSHHLSAELFKQKVGVNMVHIAYKGGSPATNDLIAGQVDVMFEWIFAAMPYVNGAEPKLRPLAITSAQRSPLLKDVPTFAELGIKGMEISNWFGVVAPAGTPAPIIAKLNEAINKALKDPEIVKSITTLGDEVVGGTPQYFDEFIKSERARWSALVKANNIKPE